jgi:hypothetical protein
MNKVGKEYQNANILLTQSNEKRLISVKNVTDRN